MPVRYEDYAMFADYSEHNSYTEAIQSENSHEWQLAMDDELKSLYENNTWELVVKPDDKIVIDNRWVYKVKKTWIVQLTSSKPGSLPRAIRSKPV